jgi:hypothetical protein
VIDDGYLRDVPVDRASALGRTLSRWSVIVGMAQAAASKAAAKRGFRPHVEKTVRLLGELQDAVAVRGGTLAVVLIPDQDPAVYTRPAWLRAYDRLMGVDLGWARQQVAAWCAARGVAYTALSRRFEDDAAAPNLRLADMHFNAAGHARAADELAEFLTERVLP